MNRPPLHETSHFSPSNLMSSQDAVNLRLMDRVQGKHREASGFDLELEAKVVGSPLLERPNGKSELTPPSHS